MKVFLLLAAGATFTLGQGDRCDISNADKWDCGFFGSTQASCEADGCCWEPVLAENGTRDTPYCYHSTDDENPCGADVVNWGGTDPGFTDEYYNIMYGLYEANLNIDGSGAVVAAPDQETPGGSYYYHWMRDAGLSIKAWLDINDNDYDSVHVVLDAYAGWVKKVQHKTDPNQIDVRVEPKFEIPSGDPYTGGWCRPQTDGPALRAMAMSKWGMILASTGKGDANEIWEIVKYDMAWVEDNWTELGCDLWEEVRSDDFYFNRMAYIYSLNVAADFGDMIGESGAAYRSLAEEIKTATKTHWKDGFLYESTNRPIDGAVIHSIATFGEYMFPPESEEAAATIRVITKSFCQEYPINQEEIQAGEVGILIGRYPGDSYAGGNPWQLLTAVLGELFYLGGQSTYREVRKRGDYTLSREKNNEWMTLLKLEDGATALQLARAQVAAGDAVMTRLFAHVQDASGRIDEQIDKKTGKQASAQGLTWSYANILHALHVRKNLDPSEKTTTPRPTGATTAGPTDGPTNPTAGPTNPTDGPTNPTGSPTTGIQFVYFTTSPNPGKCCSKVKFSSAEGINANFPEFVGEYSRVNTDVNDHGVFKKTDGNVYLHYVEEIEHKFEAWIFSEEIGDDTATVINDNPKPCPDAEAQTWSWLNGDHWEIDSTAQVICDDPFHFCCNKITLNPNFGIGRPSYKKGDLNLFHLKDAANHIEGWTIGESLSKLGSLYSEGTADCPQNTEGNWEFIRGNEWFVDSTLTVTCNE